MILNESFYLLLFKYILNLYFLIHNNIISLLTLNYFLNKHIFGFWKFSFLILSYNYIGEKGAEEVSKGISSLAKSPLTIFSLNL
jgi:hypothetical protein